MDRSRATRAGGSSPCASCAAAICGRQANKSATPRIPESTVNKGQRVIVGSLQFELVVSAGRDNTDLCTTPIYILQRANTALKCWNSLRTIQRRSMPHEHFTLARLPAEFPLRQLQHRGARSY